MQEAFLGYVLALIVGLPLGLAMGWFTTVRGLVRPIFEIIRPIPPVAWIPLTIFWFGIGLPGTVFIIWLSGIVPCVINTYTGVRMALLDRSKGESQADKWQNSVADFFGSIKRFSPAEIKKFKDAQINTDKFLKQVQLPIPSWK